MAQAPMAQAKRFEKQTQILPDYESAE
jgi:hypothetical protein